jgi:uncharacterized protein YggE
MNLPIKALASAALCALLLPAIADAQTATPPTGITVVGTGTVAVTDWVQEVSLRYAPPVGGAPNAYAACNTAIAALGETAKTLGLPANTVTASATVFTGSGLESFGVLAANPAPVAVARAQVSPADVARFLTAAGKSGWKSTSRLVPRDPAAAKDAAYRAAYADAKDRAQALAAADGRHVGKLLNVTPMLGDYLSSMMSALASFAAQLGHGSVAAGEVPEVTQSATFTFELLP